MKTVIAMVTVDKTKVTVMGMVIAFQDWYVNLTIGGELIIVNQVPNHCMLSKTISQT